MKKKIISIVSFVVFLTIGCANNHAYNPDDPDEYREHWEDNKDIKKNRLLYPHSEECKENKRKGESCWY